MRVSPRTAPRCSPRRSRRAWRRHRPRCAERTPSLHLSLEHLAVLLGAQEPGWQRAVRGPQPQQPARAVRIGVDCFGLRRKLRVARDDLTRDGCVDIGGRLDRLDDGAGLSHGHLTTRLRHFDEDEITERVLGVVGDADFHGAIRQRSNPLMGIGVLQIGGNITHQCLSGKSIKALPKRTNGGLTTRALRSLPLTSTCTEPTVFPGTRASAMERSSVGENVPLVISPPRLSGAPAEMVSLPGTTTRWWLRRTPRSSSTSPTNLRAMPPAATCARMASSAWRPP